MKPLNEIPPSPIRKSRSGFTVGCWRAHSSSNWSSTHTSHRFKKTAKKQYIARATKAHRIDQLFPPFHFASPLNSIGSAPGTFKRRACNENGAEHPRKQINTNSSPPPEERESGPWLHLPTVRKASMGEEGKAENKKGREIRK